MAEPGDDRPDAAPASGPLTRLRAQYRKRPVVALGGTAVLVGMIVAVAVIVFVGGSSEPKDTPITCTAYEQGGTLSLTFHTKVTKKEAQEGCGTSTEGLSSAAAYFVVGTPPIPEEEPRMICALTDPEKPITLVVEEVPNYDSKGERFCGALAGKGWTQTINPPAVGPSQRAYDEAKEAEEAVEAEEQEERVREQEAYAREEEAIRRCEARAESKEAAELEAIEGETEARVNAAPESREYEIEEEGYEREEEAYERREKAIEICESEGEEEAETEPGVTEPEGGTEFR